MHRAKKSLGQNFLKSEAALRNIILAGQLKKEDVVLEIGPGKGALTKQLLQQPIKVLAVEKDRDLIDFLNHKFEKEIGEGRLEIQNADILDFALEKYFKNKKYKIIANIPYNITGAILKKFLTAAKQPELMVLMVQLEVAQRIMARDGKESILSISVKTYGQARLVMKVLARYFQPAPRVDSAIITIDNISKDLFNQNKISEEKFWEIVRAGFAHKRKKLSSNLKSTLKGEKNDLLLSFGNKRAEDLKISDWIELAK